MNAPDPEDPIEDAPERPVSQHPNFVTAEGMAQIELELARRQHELAAAEIGGEPAALARIGRELRYWVARRATAQVVSAPMDTSRVHFGCSVEIGRGDGRRQTWRIVGEDQADPDLGTLSYVCPLAQALVGRALGERVRVGDSDIEILSIA